MFRDSHIQAAIEIRTIENAFLQLFAEGKLNGTVHTSVGQEFSAIAFCQQLAHGDFVFSNHRCHAHYLAFTGDPAGLVAELLGRRSGACGGIGSSQHLKKGNFFSNGIQGGIVPIAAGMALANKLQGKDALGVVFIGDGTLGQGVVYETLNMVSLWRIPLLVICEDNGYAQSTKFEDNFAGDILMRARSFGLVTFESDTRDVSGLFEEAKRSVDFVRSGGGAAFHLVKTARLNAHSKGDDSRDPAEIADAWEQDFLNRFERESPVEFQAMKERAIAMTSEIISLALTDDVLTVEEYKAELDAVELSIRWEPLRSNGKRQVSLLNGFFRRWLAEAPTNLFIGEDVLSPYGGAFKVAEGLSSEFPKQVISTPISEAGITGLANGLAIAGMRPVLEIMFGDFVTLAMDQIINHASKVYHMYNRQASCPVIIRTPMGGGRGYGPTHSQTLDRFLIGIDNVITVALNSLVDPSLIYSAVVEESHPVIVIENKSDYGREVGFPPIRNYVAEVSNEKYPSVRIRPSGVSPAVTIVTYGGIAVKVIEAIDPLFRRYDLVCEVIVLSRINPIDYSIVGESVGRTRQVAVVEEGSRIAGVGSEIISTLTESLPHPLRSLRVGADPLPIPSPRHLEDSVIPSLEGIIETIGKRFG